LGFVCIGFLNLNPHWTYLIGQTDDQSWPTVTENTNWAEGARFCKLQNGAYRTQKLKHFFTKFGGLSSRDSRALNLDGSHRNRRLKNPKHMQFHRSHGIGRMHAPLSNFKLQT
jgi:hypothetical protein